MSKIRSNLYTGNILAAFSLITTSNRC